MKGDLKLIIVMIVCTMFTSAGQIFFKLASKNFALDIIKLITNYWLIIGAVLYLIGALLMVYALKFGNLSTVYPFIALSFIWVFLLSLVIFSEKATAFKIIGTISIIIGVVMIAGSK